MKETLLIWAAALIVIFLILQIIRGFLFSKHNWKKVSQNIKPELAKFIEDAKSPSEARLVLKNIDARAIEKNSTERALIYSTAGVISLTVLKRPEIAVRYHLRALRSDPLCEVAYDRLAEILVAQKKYRRLERTCWDILSRLDEDDQGCEMWKKCWSGLTTVYANTKRLTNRADAIRKMLNVFDNESIEGFEQEEDDT